MPKFLFIGNYAAETAKTIMATGGTARRTNLEKTISGLGGRLESMNFAFGSDDVFVIADLPDNKTAAAVALTVSGTGVSHTRTVVLLTPEELDESAKIQPAYRPPIPVPGPDEWTD
jgi:uncharacterized protein with GYD domain